MRRGKNAIEAHIMGRDRNFLHDLLIECHSARRPAQFPQQLVIVSLAPAQPAALQVKG
jgi:hypothetical protein